MWCNLTVFIALIEHFLWTNLEVLGQLPACSFVDIPPWGNNRDLQKLASSLYKFKKNKDKALEQIYLG